MWLYFYFKQEAFIMSVFENINHVWISTVLISIWGFVVPE